MDRMLACIMVRLEHPSMHVLYHFRKEDDLFNVDVDAEDPKYGDKKRKKKVGEAMTPMTSAKQIQLLKMNLTNQFISKNNPVIARTNSDILRTNPVKFRTNPVILRTKKLHL